MIDFRKMVIILYYQASFSPSRRARKRAREPATPLKPQYPVRAQFRTGHYLPHATTKQSPRPAYGHRTD